MCARSIDCRGCALGERPVSGSSAALSKRAVVREREGWQCELCVCGIAALYRGQGIADESVWRTLKKKMRALYMCAYRSNWSRKTIDTSLESLLLIDYFSLVFVLPISFVFDLFTKLLIYFLISICFYFFNFSEYEACIFTFLTFSITVYNCLLN